MNDKVRCEWAQDGNDLMKEYHDKEWGVPVHDDNKLFEFLILDAFQAGLSWQIVLNKRENFRKAFDNFNPEIVATYSQAKIDILINDKGIIRNKMKILASISNAKAFLEVQQEFGSFDKYIWQFANNKTIKNKYKSWKEIPPTSKESDRMSKDLKQRGFKFVGSTICYAFMQAAGMVNDHIKTCFRFDEV